MSDPLKKPASAPDGADAQAGGGLFADLGARGLAAALRPLAGLAGMAEDIKRMAADVKRMSDFTATLPEVTETLRAIRERVDHIDDEVTEMHAAVEDMKVALDPLAGQLESVTRVTNRLPGGRKHRRAQEEAQAARDDDVIDHAHDAE